MSQSYSIRDKFDIVAMSFASQKSQTEKKLKLNLTYFKI